jgi:hypothetical protein
MRRARLLRQRFLLLLLARAPAGADGLSEAGGSGQLLAAMRVKSMLRWSLSLSGAESALAQSVFRRNVIGSAVRWRFDTAADDAMAIFERHATFPYTAPPRATA